MENLQRLIQELKGCTAATLREPSPTRDEPSQNLNDACTSEDPWSRLARLEARLRSCTSTTEDCSFSEEEDSSLSEAAYFPSSKTFSDTEPPQLDWVPINRALLQLGLPPVLDDSAEREETLPSPAAAYAALHSALQELTRSQRHVETLRYSAADASQREAILLKQLRTASRNRPEEERQTRTLVSRAQEEAANAKAAAAASKNAAEEATSQCSALKSHLAWLQRQVVSKDAETEKLRQQLQDCLDKEIQQHTRAKETVERIRRSFAAERLNLCSGSRGGGFRQPLLSPGVAAAAAQLTSLQVAKVYENQLQAAEKEAIAARVEVSLLRERFEAVQRGGSAAAISDASIASREVAAARSAAAQAQEEVSVLREEMERRPKVQDHERVQRQNEILTRRLSRLEKNQVPAKGKHNGPRPIQTLPHQVSAGVLEEVLSILGCSDPLKLPKTAREVQRSAASLPPLQTFVDAVCEAVFRQGCSHIPWTMRDEEDPSNVPSILIDWVEKLGEVAAMKGTLRALRRQLSRRPGPTTTQQQQQQQLSSGADIVPVVAYLIDMELQQQQCQQEESSLEGKKEGTASASPRFATTDRRREGEQKYHNTLVSKVKAENGFPPIEIFAPVQPSKQQSSSQPRRR